MMMTRGLLLGSSVLALSLMTGSAAWAQSPFPAFDDLGAMETATSIETANVMGHLRGLRALGNATRRVALSGVVAPETQAQPQQPPAQAGQAPVEDPIIIFDGPSGKKKEVAPSAAKGEKAGVKSKTKKTKKKSKMYNPALYLDNGEQESVDERGAHYDLLPKNDKQGGSFFDAIGELFGGPVAHAPQRKDLPRTASLTTRDISPKTARHQATNPVIYPGQPLGAYNNAVSGQGGIAPKYAMVTVYGPSSQTNIKNVAPAGQKFRDSTDVQGGYEWINAAPSSAAQAEKPAHAHILKGPKESFEGYVKDLSPTASKDAPHYGNTAVPLDDGETINPDRRWGVFVTGDAVFGNQENVKGEGSSKVDAGGFTAGVDYRLMDKTFVGLALTYAHENFKVGDASDVSGDSVMVSLYGTTSYLDNAYADGFLSLGHHGFDNERTLGGGTPSAVTATSSPSGFTFNAKAETGYNFRNAGFVFGPFGSFRLMYASLDSYAETGIDGMNHDVDDLSRVSAIASLGVGGSRSFALANGGSIAPSLRLAYNHEFGETQIESKTSIVGAPITFKTKGTRRTRDWVNVAPALTANLPASWQLQASYAHDFFRKDVNENLFNMGAKYRW